MTDILASAAPIQNTGAVAGERHVSEVAGRGPALGRKAGVGMIVAATVLAGGFILLSSSPPDLRAGPASDLAVRPTIRFEPPPSLPQMPPLQPVAMPMPPPLPPAPPLQMAQQAPARPQQQRLLVFGGSGSAARPSPSPGSTDGPRDWPAGAEAPEPSGPARLSGQAGGSGLATRLQATPTTAVSASVLANQPYLLTMGTLMPCTLQTAMDSTLPGLVTCIIPQDVLGRTGLVLLDRGTRVVGQFQGDIRQGIERMFVLWTRAETPQGVVIALDSPASDPLGRSGMDGEVDHRFWQRFGGALLLSVV